MRDFTHAEYASLLRALKKNAYEFLCFADIPGLGETRSEPTVFLRHDVDRMPGRSMRLARLEAEHGVRSTYFFRSKPISFNREIILSIAELGHEIGYHYETLSDARGNYETAWRLFREELHRFSALCEVKSIAMHGRPFSPWDNRDLWKHFDYREAGIKVEAYEDMDWGRYLYFTDTGRCWNSRSNVRDHVGVASATEDHSSVTWTEDLIGFINERRPNLVVSTHPERWTSGVVGWVQVYVTDKGINFAKRIVKGIRRGVSQAGRKEVA